MTLKTSLKGLVLPEKEFIDASLDELRRSGLQCCEQNSLGLSADGDVVVSEALQKLASAERNRALTAREEY